MVGVVLLDESGKKRRREQAEAWLLKCRRLVKLEASLRRLAEAQRDMADGIRGIDYSRDLVQVSASDDGMVNQVSRLIEVAEELRDIAETVSDRREQAEVALRGMENPTEAAILIDYYLVGLSWEETADKNHYAGGYIYEKRDRALLNAYSVMPHYEREQVPRAD